MKLHLLIPLVAALSVLSNTKAWAAGDATAHVALFSGATIHYGHAAPTFGLEAEYLVPGTGGILGVGPLFETVLDTHTIGIAAAILTLHPFAGVRVLAGPGVEYVEGHTAVLVRGGLGYDFHIDRFSITPLASLDYIEGSFAQVYGLAFGVGF